MEIFIGLVVISLIGIVFVFYLIKNDTGPGGLSVKKIDPSEIKSRDLMGDLPPSAEPETTSEKKSPEKPKKQSLFAKILPGKKDKTPKAPKKPKAPKTPKPKKKGGGGLFAKLNFAKKKDPHEGKPMPSLKDALKEEGSMDLSKPADEGSDADSNPPTSATEDPFSLDTESKDELKSTPTTPPEELVSPAEEKKIEEEIELSSEVKELKEQNEKLEQLNQEKIAQLDKTQQALDNEVKNRKDFNKVKDVLEKELSDVKAKVKESQTQLNDAKSEAEGYKNRIDQLEQKATQLEKEIGEKEKENDDLIKRLQTFASPSTADTPPVKEESAPANETSPEAAPETSTEEAPAKEADQVPEEPATEEQPAAEENASKDDTPAEPESQAETIEPEPAPESEEVPSDAEKESESTQESDVPLPEPEAEIAPKESEPETTEPPQENQPEPEIEKPKEPEEDIKDIQSLISEAQQDKTNEAAPTESSTENNVEPTTVESFENSIDQLNMVSDEATESSEDSSENNSSENSDGPDNLGIHIDALDEVNQESDTETPTTQDTDEASAEETSQESPMSLQPDIFADSDSSEESKDENANEDSEGTDKKE